MNKKGFTLIEILSVIAIIGILVLFSTPKYMEHIEESETLKTQTDINKVEAVLSLLLIKNPELNKDWESIPSEEIQEMNDSEKLFSSDLKTKDNLNDGQYVPIKSIPELNKIQSQATFILASDGKVYFYQKTINSP